MRITVMGTGYVGLVTGTCLAELGNQVLCLDVDEHKIQQLNQGESPIYEPGLTELIRSNLSAQRLRFTTQYEVAVAHGEVLFIAVGTPPCDDGRADLQHVLSAARRIGQDLSGFKVIVNKSTVPVGTAEKVKEVIQQQLALRQEEGESVDATFCVISNPEFLKEGAAVDDFMRPDRIILGLGKTSLDERARDLMRQLYAPFNRHHDRTWVMDVRSAELTKYAANAMLATRISFMNEIANLAEHVGADIESVRQGIGSDPRIGYSFLYAGTGYGGSCFPKDVKALLQIGQDHDLPMSLLHAVESVNQRQKQVIMKKIVQRLGTDLSHRRFAVWGLAFKPGTDDMREAPSRGLIRQLLEMGASVVAHDPVAIHQARLCFSHDLKDQPEWLGRLHLAPQAMTALDQADALIIMTEWKAFKSPDFQHMKRLLKQALIFDGRNLYEPESMAQWGFEYQGIGRSSQCEPMQPKIAQWPVTN